MTSVNSSLSWSLRVTTDCSVATFTIDLPNGLLTPAHLSRIALPPELSGHESKGLIISGRGPIWLYSHLTHLAHPFAWVAVHEPRLEGAVVVQCHRPGAPTVGTIAPLPA